MNKAGKWFPCLIHCLIYTFSVTVFTLTFVPLHLVWLWALIVFATHFPIDYWSLADKWLLFIDGRSLKDYIEHGHENIPDKVIYGNYHTLRGGFTAVVYAVVDNTMHLVLMYVAAMILL